MANWRSINVRQPNPNDPSLIRPSSWEVPHQACGVLLEVCGDGFGILPPSWNGFRPSGSSPGRKGKCPLITCCTVPSFMITAARSPSFSPSGTVTPCGIENDLSPSSPLTSSVISLALTLFTVPAVTSIVTVLPFSSRYRNCPSTKRSNNLPILSPISSLMSASAGRALRVTLMSSAWASGWSRPFFTTLSVTSSPTALASTAFLRSSNFETPCPSIAVITSPGSRAAPAPGLSGTTCLIARPAGLSDCFTLTPSQAFAAGAGVAVASCAVALRGPSSPPRLAAQAATPPAARARTTTARARILVARNLRIVLSLQYNHTIFTSCRCYKLGRCAPSQPRGPTIRNLPPIFSVRYTWIHHERPRRAIRHDPPRWHADGGYLAVGRRQDQDRPPHGRARRSLHRGWLPRPKPQGHRVLCPHRGDGPEERPPRCLRFDSQGRRARRHRSELEGVARSQHASCHDRRQSTRPARHPRPRDDARGKFRDDRRFCSPFEGCRPDGLSRRRALLRRSRGESRLRV